MTESQQSVIDSGLGCLKTLGAFHQVSVDEAELRHELSAHLESGPDGTRLFGIDAILLAAKRLGLTARLIKQDPDRLDKAPWPAIGRHQDGRFFVIAKFDPGLNPETGQSRPKMLIQHAGQPPEILTIEDLLAQWTGEVIFFISGEYQSCFGACRCRGYFCGQCKANFRLFQRKYQPRRLVATIY